MSQCLVECVPNVSEGRDLKVLDQLSSILHKASQIFLLDRHVDPDHHRTVFTLVGEPRSMSLALFDFIQKAHELIDLQSHKGQHPRIGVVDVVPWIPYQGVTMEDCALYARQLGKRVGEELEVPVYLYGYTGTTTNRFALPNIRQGGTSGLKKRMQNDPFWKPDFGPSYLPEKSGAMAIGARFFLIAFNVILETPDLLVGRSIAETVRSSGGGLPALKALAFSLPSRGVVQVSMNLTDYRETSLRRAFLAVKHQALSMGTKVLESEIVGLVPQAAWDDRVNDDLQLITLRAEAPGQGDPVLERRLAAAQGS